MVFVHDPSLPSAQLTTLMARIEAGLPNFPLADVVVATSGSSGTPRLVALSAAALHASARATNDVLAAGNLTGHAPLPPPQLCWVLALPTFHVAGLLVLWRALQAGASLLVADASGGFSSDVLADVLSHTPPRSAVVPLVPTQLQKLLAHPRALAALSQSRAVLVGGAALPAPVAASAAAAGLPIVTTYGMSETSGGCVYNGSPLPGVEVQVEPAARPPLPNQTAQEDQDGRKHLAESPQTGRIWLSGPSLALGYLGDRASTAAAFVTAAGKRWHVTADLGRWEGSTLTVLGRSDWLINTGGEKVSPATVEDALLVTGLVREACVVGVPDPYWGQAVVAVVSPAADLLPTSGSPSKPGAAAPSTVATAHSATATPQPSSQASSHCGAPPGASTPLSPAFRRALEAACESWPAPLRPKRVVELAALPLLPNGKVDRAACAALARRA